MQHFDLVTAFDEFGCTCGTTGSFKSPKFNSSADVIECDDGEGSQLTGTIKGKKLGAQSVNEDGSSEIFSCTPTPACG